MKIEGMKLEKAKFIAIASLFIFAISLVTIKVIFRGFGYKHLLMAFGVFAMTIVLFCMTWPDEARKIVQKNSKPIYAVFMLLITPTFFILSAVMAANAVRNWYSEDALFQTMGSIAGIAILLIFSTDIISYKALFSKIKKAVRI